MPSSRLVLHTYDAEFPHMELSFHIWSKINGNQLWPKARLESLHWTYWTISPCLSFLCQMSTWTTPAKYLDWLPVLVCSAECELNPGPCILFCTASIVWYCTNGFLRFILVVQKKKMGEVLWNNYNLLILAVIEVTFVRNTTGNTLTL